jgi:hypothetical protein
VKASGLRSLGRTVMPSETSGYLVPTYLANRIANRYLSFAGRHGTNRPFAEHVFGAAGPLRSAFGVLKIGTSTVRPRPWPPNETRSGRHRGVSGVDFRDHLEPRCSSATVALTRLQACPGGDAGRSVIKLGRPRPAFRRAASDRGRIDHNEVSRAPWARHPLVPADQLFGM